MGRRVRWDGRIKFKKENERMDARTKGKYYQPVTSRTGFFLLLL